MAIKRLNKDRFEDILQSVLSASHPIRTEDLLYGRADQLRKIDQALAAKGRQIFLYGERGVGKTSLALTAANARAYGGAPIYKVCTPDSTFYSLIESIIADIIENPTRDMTTVKTSGQVNVGVAGFGANAQQEVSSQKGRIPELKDINTTIALIKHVAKNDDSKRIIIIDEFDRIRALGERERFADFLKQLGDQDVPWQVIFCGVGRSTGELFDAHNSTFRYFHSVHVPPLDYTARFEIIDRSAKALGVKVGDPYRFRIAAISDGFAHYVHLICEKLYWEMFNDSAVCDSVFPEHYKNALNEAVMEAELQLRPAYDSAILKRSNYESVLWAAAAHYEFRRKIDQIYEFHEEVLASKMGFASLPKLKFTAKLRYLKSDSCDQILSSPKPGWYEFRENMVRGYVRLRAEQQGIELPFDYTPEPNPRLPNVGQPRLRPVRVPGFR